MRAPVVERVAPELADGAERVGRRAGDDAALEELGMGVDVGAAVGDVDRDVAEQPDAALGARTRAARSTRGRSAPGRRSRALPAKARPVGDPVALAVDERLELRGRDRAPAVPRAARATSANAEADAYGEPSPVGRSEREQLPTTTGRPRPASRRSDTPRAPSRPPGSEVGCSRTPLDRSNLHTF